VAGFLKIAETQDFAGYGADRFCRPFFATCVFVIRSVYSGLPLAKVVKNTHNCHLHQNLDRGFFSRALQIREPPLKSATRF
jgi:hypothetical protein